MIHGFPACPYVFSYFADYFSSIGYDVYVPLLPGFGTNPKDLEKTSFNQWYGYIRQYYLDLRKKYPKVIIMVNVFVNGKDIHYDGPDMKLLPFLRNHLHLTGAKDGCSEGA